MYYLTRGVGMTAKIDKLKQVQHPPLDRQLK